MPGRSKRGSRARLLLGLLLVSVTGCGASRASAVPGGAASQVRALEPAAAALERALGVPGLRGAALSVLVVDRASGAVLFERDANRALLPASNQKILTAVAALAAFGPTHRFVTEVRAPAPPDAQGRIERLLVRAGGDPALTSEQWWRLAADLRALGVREIADGLVIDDQIFDDERWHPSWQPVSARAYHAPVSALTANYGAFRVRVAPGAQPGDPALVHLDPPVAYLEVSNQAVTGPRGRGPALRVDRVALGDRERVIVAGSIPQGHEGRDVYRSVAHPSRYAAAVLRLQLEANGIRVQGPTRRGAVSAEAPLLLEFEGHELSRLVDLFVKNSNNMIAEALVKSLGRGAEGVPAGWRSGTRAVREQLEGLGVDLRDSRLADGSGLSRDNRVSARVLVDVLRAADASFLLGPELVGSLPIAGRDGTLRKRAAASLDRVRAKTGLLTGVTGLSGLAQTRAERKVVFSILANDYRQGDRAAMDALDGFAAALLEAF